MRSSQLLTFIPNLCATVALFHTIDVTLTSPCDISTNACAVKSLKSIHTLLAMPRTQESTDRGSRPVGFIISSSIAGDRCTPQQIESVSFEQHFRVFVTFCSVILYCNVNLK